MDNSILIVDDDPGVLSALKRTLADEPYEIFTAASGVDGLEILNKHQIKLIISDEKMPGMPGSEFLTAAKKIFPNSIRIMLTGYADMDAAMKAINSGEIYRFFSKPWDDMELKMSIRRSLEKYDLEEENRNLLKTVKRQEGELKQLEESHPGITSLKKDEEGSFVLPEISDADQELSEIISESKLNVEQD